MNLLDKIKATLETQKTEDKDFYFNRGKKIMASTTLPTEEDIKKEKVGLAPKKV